MMQSNRMQVNVMQVNVNWTDINSSEGDILMIRTDDEGI